LRDGRKQFRVCRPDLFQTQSGRRLQPVAGASSRGQTVRFVTERTASSEDHHALHY
jgi:hypothetical protein